METLKRSVAEYVLLKEDLKRMTDRKNQLEKAICSTMDEFEITTFELPNGNSLTYKVKESLSMIKEKTKAKNKDD
jgi:hypothetical protein